MIFRIAACLTILIGTVGIAREQSEPHFDVATKQATDKGFAPPPLALRACLAAHDAPKTIQHLCVIGYGTDASGLRAYVHWREGARLTLWYPAVFNPQTGLPRVDTLIYSSRDLSLKTDIVATKVDIRGSTYLEPRAWANRIIGDCKKYGRSYTIRPK